MEIISATFVGLLFIGSVIAISSWLFIAIWTLLDLLDGEHFPSYKRIVVVLVPLILFLLWGSYILGTYFLKASGHR